MIRMSRKRQNILAQKLDCIQCGLRVAYELYFNLHPWTSYIV
jgi:hypothetical protein